LKPRAKVPGVVVWVLATLLSLAMPAWGGIYTIEQLFMLPLEALMEITVETVISPVLLE